MAITAIVLFEGVAHDQLQFFAAQPMSVSAVLLELRFARKSRYVRQM